LEALIKNEFLDDEFFEQLLKRIEPFDDVPDSKFRQFLVWLGENPRMSKPCDERTLDGWAEYSHNRVFALAWELAKTLPTEPVYARDLSSLLSRTEVPVDFESAHEAIERWRLPSEARGSAQDTSSYWLRNRLADALEPDDRLLNSNDLALRDSFYRRFDPHKYKNWPKFIEKDGTLAFDAMVNNDSLWRSGKFRYWLRKLAWIIPDPNSLMDAPKTYQAVEKGYRKRHPKWFRKKDDEYDENSDDPVDHDIADWLKEKRRSSHRETDETLRALREEDRRDEPVYPLHAELRKRLTLTESRGPSVEQILLQLIEDEGIGSDTREEMREFLEDYRAGRLEGSDRQYIIALHTRLREQKQK
jgi:hypothetical protein